MFGRVPTPFHKDHWIHLDFCKSCVEVINRVKLGTLKSSDCSLDLILEPCQRTDRIFDWFIHK